MRLPESLKTAFANFEGEAWLRFFIAVIGLGLAFVAAILSSIARESGNTAATALFASTALLLAGTVGLTTVPYLARQGTVVSPTVPASKSAVEANSALARRDCGTHDCSLPGQVRNSRESHSPGEQERSRSISHARRLRLRSYA